MSPESNLTKALPIYGEKPERPGLYLGLFHGRNDPREEMNDWGFHGPMIGPLKWVHTTYAFKIRIAFECGTDARRYFSTSGRVQSIELNDDLLKFGGKFYGDWTVYTVEANQCRLPDDTFRNVQRPAEHWAHVRT